MSPFLDLSHNELWTLLKHVFQGMFGHELDWGALAEYILWLETRGFNGVELLQEAINTNVLREFSGKIINTPKGYIIDFQGNSVLMGLPIIIDLAVDYVRRIGDCEIAVISTTQSKALVAVEIAILRYGLYSRIENNRLFCQSTPIKLARNWSEAERVYLDSLENGIPINRQIYTALNKIADQTLVETSEASRSGAGE